VEVQPPPAPHRVPRAVATRPKDVPARPTAVPTIPKARETANREPAPKLPPYSEPEPPKPVELAAPAVVPETPVAAPPAIEAKPEERVPHSVTIPDGTVLRVRIGEAVSTKKNRAGDAFSGTLDQELVADGFVIAERGAKVEGRVSQSEEAGRTRGLSHLGLELTAIHTSDGQIVRIQTARFEQLGTASRMEDWAKVGVGTAIGGAIGAAAGGGKGAAIGAAAGAAAGAGTAAATRTKPAEIAVETRISFKLEQPVMLTEKLP
jgi:hypothetical protein